MISGNVEVVAPVMLLPCSDNKLDKYDNCSLKQLPYDALHSIY